MGNLAWMTSVFRVDVHEQAHVLRDFGKAPVSLGLYSLLRKDHDRIILTGAGASHFAALPSWRRLTSGGRDVCWIDARQLIANPELITPNSLLVATSRSGRSDDVVALVTTLSENTRPAAIIALTDDLASPLAGVADSEILLRSQSSGSPRGFLNILAAHDYITSMILGQDNDDVMATARVVAATKIPGHLTQAAASLAEDPNSRLVYIGFSEHAAAALYAALLTQEVTTVTADGYPSDDFDPHAAPAGLNGSTAVLFTGRDPADNARAVELAADLDAAGAEVVLIGSRAVGKATCIRTPTGHVSAQMAHSVVIAEYFVSLLAA